ncbi:MAG: cupin domain-containing protein [Steroidobacteraceae bacterium]
MSASSSPQPAAFRWPGFVDVGSFAREPVVARDGGEFLARRRWVDLPPGPISVAAVSVGAGGEHGISLPGEEFVLVRTGTLRLRQAGVEIALAAGEQALLLRGLPLSWSSDGGAQLVVLRCTAGSAPAVAQPVKIDTAAALAPSNPPLAELLVGPTPQCRSHASYRTSSGEFVCGTWDSTPYHRLPMTFQHFELMHLLEGRVTFVDSNGAAGTFAAGDVVLFVRGGTVSWESREYVKKAYAWFRPA